MAIAKKKRKRWIAVAIVVILAAAGVLGYRTMTLSAAPAHPMVETTALELKDLQNLVSVTGNVESTNSKKIYAPLASPVEELLVEVGDYVEEGELLCRLDTSSFESSIAKTQATINKSQTAANQQLTDAQRDLANAKELLEKDLNTQLLTAQGQVRSAEQALETAEASLEKAAISVLDARAELRSAKDLADIDNDYDDAGNYIADADGTVASYKRAANKSEIDYESAKEAVTARKQDLEDAKVNLKAVEESVNQSLEKYESSVTSAKQSMDYTDQYITIDDLKTDVEKCDVTAPVSGTVTAVYVSEGATPNGIMFVIEDTNSLKVSTKVMEYDIASIALGNPVEIKSDATGEAVYSGKLEKIAPTSVKNAAGDSDTSSDTEFEAEIAVTGSTDLKIGMKARMNIIYEEKKASFSVPYDAIGMNENGESVIYIARPDESGNYFVEAVTVTTGMETDFDTEVVSPDIKEGDLVITNITGVTPGMQVMLAMNNMDMGAMSGGPMRGGVVVVG